MSDPFDPASLRINPANAASLGAQKLLVTVPVRKPNRQEFFRVSRDPEYRMPMAVLELKEEREVYCVTPEMASQLGSEVRPVMMLTCINRMGQVFLWPLPLPTADGRVNSWHQSARAAAEEAEKQWCRMAANMGAGAYDIWRAPEGVSDPEWPKHDFRELLRLAFGNGRLIDSVDHPVLKRLRGE
jgi:hypothetical protein